MTTWPGRTHCPVRGHPRSHLRAARPGERVRSEPWPRRRCRWCSSLALLSAGIELLSALTPVGLGLIACSRDSVVQVDELLAALSLLVALVLVVELDHDSHGHQGGHAT